MRPLARSTRTSRKAGATARSLVQSWAVRMWLRWCPAATCRAGTSCARYELQECGRPYEADEQLQHADRGRGYAQARGGGARETQPESQHGRAAVEEVEHLRLLRGQSPGAEARHADERRHQRPMFGEEEQNREGASRSQNRGEDERSRRRLASPRRHDILKRPAWDGRGGVELRRESGGRQHRKKDECGDAGATAIADCGLLIADSVTEPLWRAEPARKVAVNQQYAVRNRRLIGASATSRPPPPRLRALQRSRARA